jgi:putative two-component system response regulator
VGDEGRDYQSESRASMLDALTGLFNHGYFHHALRQELERSQRYGTQCTVALVGLDSLGAFNRLHGFASGDKRIAQTATILAEALRQSDLAARYEGGILAAILPHTDCQSATAALDRARVQIHKKMGADATVSIGVVEVRVGRQIAGPLMDAALEVLERARREGGNRTVTFAKVEAEPRRVEARILVVDDIEQNRRLLKALLTPVGYEIIEAANGDDALSAIHHCNVDLVLLDIMMPGIDGIEVCRRIKSNRATRMIPVVMVTGLDDVDAKVKAIDAGADDFLTKPANRHEMLARVRNLVRSKKLNEDLTSMEDVLISLANAVEARDKYTEGHVQRVANLATSTGRVMGCTPEQIRALRLGGVLHDIGKLGTPDNILNKPGKLDAQEWEIIRLHPVVGNQICLPLQESLGEALSIVRQHHEKLDGSGYPDGLVADEIGLVARILAVVDIYDALVTDRAYRKGMDQERAIAILQEEADAGKLDSEVLKQFLTLL